MLIVRKKQRKDVKTANNLCHEYDFGGQNLDCSVIEIKGRYPERGLCRNTKVDELIFVKSGTGRLVFDNEVFDLKQDDAVLIHKNDWYFWSGETDASLLVVCTPAWSEDQVEFKMTPNLSPLTFKKIEEKDSAQLFALIDRVLKGLENPEYFIPYEQWEFDSMFDEENYAPLYGAYDGDKLVGMAQLYVSQKMLADFKKDFGFSQKIQVAELGGNLVLPEYRGLGITTALQKIELELAKKRGFDYVISMAHPDNVGSCKTLEKIGLEYVNEQKVANGFLRKLYMKKLK